MSEIYARYLAKGITEKTCKQCNLAKPITDFSPNHGYLQSRCKECRYGHEKGKREQDRLDSIAGYEATGIRPAEARARARGITEKKCVICKKVKSVSDFPANSVRFLSSYCHECSRIKQDDLRRERGIAERRPRAEIGSVEDGFVCFDCKTKKPAEEFRIRYRGGRRDELRKQCRDCEKEYIKRKSRTPKGRYRYAKNSAKMRQLAFDLSLAEYTALRESPCFYCGFSLNISGIGLDRKDCLGGYTKDNVVPCCWECNQAKSDRFSVEEMQVIGKAIGVVKQQRIDDGKPISLPIDKTRPYTYHGKRSTRNTSE